MTDTPYDDGLDDELDSPEAGQLTIDEELELVQDTSESNGESDYPDPPQVVDLDAIEEDPLYETED